MPENKENRPRPRDDGPGVWHHVMNRGLARRPAFEGRDDIRFFLSRIARRVREGQIELHAYAILTTHFHLLVRSPRGELSEAMMWIENQYVRRFNRIRDRDGSLFRGRFTSRVVDSISYWHTLLRYIDENAVHAGLVQVSAEYPYGSARHYCRPAGPIWLTRSVVEREVMSVDRGDRYDPASYARSFPSPLGEDGRWIVERRTSRGSSFQSTSDDLDDLISAAPERIRSRLEARARLADRVGIGMPVASPGAVLDELNRARSARPVWVLIHSTGRSVSAWQVLAAGLLRSGSGLSLRETAHRLGLGVARVARAERVHADLLEQSQEYGTVSGCVLSAAVGRSISAGRTKPAESALDLRRL